MKTKKVLLQELKAQPYSLNTLAVYCCFTPSEAKASIENDLYKFNSLLTQRLQGNKILWHDGQMINYSTNFICQYIIALKYASNFLNYNIIEINDYCYKLVSK